MKQLPTFVLLAAVAGSSLAEKETIIVPPQPRGTGEPEGQEEIEPEVVIIQREDKTIEEYRVNGQLYMIKVTPKHGPPYYLVDNDGNGTLETRRVGGGLEPDLMTPQWVIFRW